MQPSTTATQYRSPKVILFVVAGLCLLGLWYLAANPTQKPKDPLVGQQRHLINPGFQTVTLFTSNDDLDKGVLALEVGDDAHAIQIARRGRDIPTGSLVTVVATDRAYGHPSAQVRLLDGASGWVTTDKLAP